MSEEVRVRRRECREMVVGNQGRVLVSLSTILNRSMLANFTYCITAFNTQAVSLPKPSLYLARHRSLLLL